MNSKNFKKVLSTSIASLTVLSTLSGSVSTKIYATAEDGIFGFSKNGCIYSLNCSELTKDNSNKAALNIIEEATNGLNEKNTELKDKTPVELKANENIVACIKKFLEENNEQTGKDEYDEKRKGVIAAVIKILGDEIEKQSKSKAEDASSATEEGKEEVKEEAKKEELQATGAELVGDDGKTGEKTIPTQQPTGADEKTTPTQQPTGADEKTEQTTAEVKKEETGSDNNNQQSTETDGAKQTPADSQEPAEGKTPAIDVSDKSKGSIFKRAFNAIKGFFSNIFNFVCGLFHKVK